MFGCKDAGGDAMVSGMASHKIASAPFSIAFSIFFYLFLHCVGALFFFLTKIFSALYISDLPNKVHLTLLH